MAKVLSEKCKISIPQKKQWAKVDSLKRERHVIVAHIVTHIKNKNYKLGANPVEKEKI